MKKPRLVCIGDLMLDVVVRAEVSLEEGTDVPGTVRFRLGGSAGNTCRTFVALGGKASFVGAMGTDPLGRRLDSALRDAGVTARLVRVAGTTPRLAALVAPSGERSFVTERGVADSLAPSALKPAWFARADVLHVPAYSLLRPPLSDSSLRAISLARQNHALVSVDLASRAPLLAVGADTGLRAVRAAAPDVLFANVDEVTALVGRRGAARLLDLAPVVVVKLGQGGCRVLWRGTGARSVMEIEVATKPIAAADTTGAGDAFAAGFLYSIVSMASIGEGGFDRAAPSSAALRRASLAGHKSAARLLTSRRPELAL
jgi:sugar/nucleoside kinase (ribokinase family)